MPHTAEVFEELAKMREKVLSGTYNIDDIRRYVQLAREDRVTAAPTIKVKKKKEKPAINTLDLFEQLKS